MATIKRLSRRVSPTVLEKMIYMPVLSEEDVRDKDRTTAWFTELQHRLNSDESSALRYEIKVEQSAETPACRTSIIEIAHSVPMTRELNGEFFSSGEYRSMVELGGKLDGLLGEDAYIQRGEQQQKVGSFKQALDWLFEEAKRGQHIQRYKGLGEMNPSQLWETTLDAEVRRLLRVQIEDAVAADEMFTTLMGDQVEPRRAFIEKNALTVANLDI
jgi:DNA gyrase subunit B